MSDTRREPSYRRNKDAASARHTFGKRYNRQQTKGVIHEDLRFELPFNAIMGLLRGKKEE